MSFICTDQGASNTRFIVNNGKVCVNPNNAVIVDLDADIRLIPNSSDILDNLDVTIIKTEGESEYFPVRVLMGSMAERHSSSNIRPSMMLNKAKQQINYISILVACAVGQIQNNVSDPVKLFINLPPIEIRENEDYVKEQLLGKYTVTFNKSNEKTDVNIEFVKVCPESVMAVFAFFFKSDGSPRIESAKYSRGYVLGIDIGASTSDLVLVKDRKFVDRTGYTYKIGGNVITDIMRSKVRSIYGSELTDDDANTVITEGRLPYGSKYKDMSKELVEAKKEFADLLYEKMNSYFGTVDISLPSIKAIFVSGGGSMKSRYYDDEQTKEVITSESVSYYLTEKLKGICDGIDIMEFPGDNPRMTNIIGTALTANVMKSKLEN